MAKTTKKDFEAFKAAFSYYQDLFGLKDWRVCFEHGDAHQAYAEIFANCEGRIATVVFADKCDECGLVGYDPVNTGRHEALELLIAPLKDLARKRTFSEDDLDASSHAVIRRLENLFDSIEEKK